jgi:hypothetical protein
VAIRALFIGGGGSSASALDPDKGTQLVGETGDVSLSNFLLKWRTGISALVPVTLPNNKIPIPFPFYKKEGVRE